MIEHIFKDQSLYVEAVLIPETKISGIRARRVLIDKIFDTLSL